jgi:hypothetical protein
MSSDDPEYPHTLAGVLSDAGRPREAERWRVRAASRWQQLVAHHPDAFAHQVIVVRADQRTKHPPPGSTGVAMSQSEHPPGADHAGLSTWFTTFRS